MLKYIVEIEISIKLHRYKTGIDIYAVQLKIEISIENYMGIKLGANKTVNRCELRYLLNYINTKLFRKVV